MNDVNMRRAVLVTREGATPSDFYLHLMEGADNGQFARDTHCTAIVYRPRITELSARAHLGSEVVHFGYGHGHVYHPRQAGTRGNKLKTRWWNDNYGSASTFHPDRQMQAKIPPLAKNEVMDTGKVLEPKTRSLAGKEPGCGVCMCIWSHFA